MAQANSALFFLNREFFEKYKNYIYAGLFSEARQLCFNKMLECKDTNTTATLRKYLGKTFIHEATYLTRQLSRQNLELKSEAKAQLSELFNELKQIESTLGTAAFHCSGSLKPSQQFLKMENANKMLRDIADIDMENANKTSRDIADIDMENANKTWGDIAVILDADTALADGNEYEDLGKFSQARNQYLIAMLQCTDPATIVLLWQNYARTFAKEAIHIAIAELTIQGTAITTTQSLPPIALALANTALTCLTVANNMFQKLPERARRTNALLLKTINAEVPTVLTPESTREKIKKESVIE